MIFLRGPGQLTFYLGMLDPWHLETILLLLKNEVCCHVVLLQTVTRHWQSLFLLSDFLQADRITCADWDCLQAGPNAKAW